MATSDFRFRVSKAVGSPSVQGAGSMETLANHTENPHPHPQYMRKSYVGLDLGLTEHLANRLHHARNYALRDELTTTKLEYERYKLISLARDVSNYMAESGVKAHVITAYVLNQILDDVGLDGSVEALTYNNLVNSYDTKVVDASRYAPTWEIFLRLKNSIYDWMIGGSPNDYLLKANWKEWIRYMYGEVDPDQDTHPLRAGLKVALYASDKVYGSFTHPGVGNEDPIGYANIANKTFVPTLASDTFADAGYYYKQTSDATPVAGKEYISVVDKHSVVFTGSTFVSGTTYFEKVYFDLHKVQGDYLTNGCSILECNCSRTHPSYFDWYNGQKWTYYAGNLGNATDPWGMVMMVWEGRIRLRAGQTIKFAGVVDDYVVVKIGSTVLTKQSNTNFWQNLGDHQDESEYSDCTVYSYTASVAGLYNFTLAIVNKQTVGPKSGVETGNLSAAVPFRISYDNGATYVPITNEVLDQPIFFLPDNSEKEVAKTAELRDQKNYQPERMPGLLVKSWKSPNVSQAGEIDTSTYPMTADNISNIKRLWWPAGPFIGDATPSEVDRSWTIVAGPSITNGCGLLAKYCTHDDPKFFDWYNCEEWEYYGGNPASSQTDPWKRRVIGWFGAIFLNKGETVSFQGKIDDKGWIQIDDTWVLDGASPVDDPVSYTATYTGLHPFKLLIYNLQTVGPALSDNSHLRVNFGGTWYDISNDGLPTPRFFLPEDCDNRYYWDKGAVARDRRATDSSSMIKTIYPVGSVIINMDGVNQPFPGSGTTWELIGQGKTLWGYNPDEAPTPTAVGETKDAGLPDIQGKVGQTADPSDGEVLTGIDSDAPGNNLDGTDHTKSALHLTDRTTSYGGLGSNAGSGYKTLSFEASRHNSIYGNSTTVQPPAIVVAFWKRTA